MRFVGEGAGSLTQYAIRITPTDTISDIWGMKNQD